MAQSYPKHFIILAVAGLWIYYLNRNLQAASAFTSANGQSPFWILKKHFHQPSDNKRNSRKYFLFLSGFWEEIHVSGTRDSGTFMRDTSFLSGYCSRWLPIVLITIGTKNNLIKYHTSGHTTCDDFWWNFIEYYSTHAALRCPTVKPRSEPTLNSTTVQQQDHQQLMFKRTRLTVNIGELGASE